MSRTWNPIETPEQAEAACLVAEQRIAEVRATLASITPSMPKVAQAAIFATVENTARHLRDVPAVGDDGSHNMRSA